jgi:hypothetical protein
MALAPGRQLFRKKYSKIFDEGLSADSLFPNNHKKFAALEEH